MRKDEKLKGLYVLGKTMHVYPNQTQYQVLQGE